MSKQLKQLEKLTFNAVEGLNILFSDEYTFDTSSSNETFLQSSYSERSTDRNAESPPPKWKKILKMKTK